MIAEHSHDYNNAPLPHGWIQWKGTNVCMDIYCTCGAHLHADEEFFYHFQCGQCGQFYEVGTVVKLYPVATHPTPGRGIPRLSSEANVPPEVAL